MTSNHFDENIAVLENQVLTTLDYTYSFGFYYSFIPIDHPYSYLIDCRLNIFKGDRDRWAIAAEILGYNPRGGRIELQICYYGNCLINLEEYNNQKTNDYRLFPIDDNSFEASIDGENLKTDASFWLVNGSKVLLSTNKQDYVDNGIDLKEYEPNEIGIEEAARLCINTHAELFRASDEALYKSIPKDLKKILVLDEWYHKPFLIMDPPLFSADQLRSLFEFNQDLGSLAGMDFETFEKLHISQMLKTDEYNKSQWDENRPSVYETWQQITKVIATGDILFYKPTLKPNTHWINWPESGSL